MKLTKLIFKYWTRWMNQPKGIPVHTDGIYFPSHSDYPMVQFWWALNASWYKMNKSLAHTWATNSRWYVPFVCPKDFEDVL
jgi:hypothetical protein